MNDKSSPDKYKGRWRHYRIAPLNLDESPLLHELFRRTIPAMKKAPVWLDVPSVERKSFRAKYAPLQLAKWPGIRSEVKPLPDFCITISLQLSSNLSAMLEYCQSEIILQAKAIGV